MSDPLEEFMSTLSPALQKDASASECYLPPATEASLFCNLADLEEQAEGALVKDEVDESPRQRRDSTATEMFAKLDIEGAAGGLSYQGPIGPHPSTGLLDSDAGDLPLDEPFDEWEDSLHGEAWIEAALAEGGDPFSGENDDQPMYARAVKYHRDRDFLNKYGWRRIINAKTNKVVYQHEEGRWPEQPSVKAARRAMRAFFDERREERRNPEAGKRRRGATEKAGEEEAPPEASSPRAAAPEVVKCVTVKPPPCAPPAFDYPTLYAPAAADTDASGNGKRAKTIEYKPPLLASVVVPSELKPPVSNFEAIDEDSMDKQERRKHKNRQAAATSRKRQQDHRKLLEDENKKLMEENAYLRKMLAEYTRGQKPDAVVDPNGTGTTLGDPIEMLGFA